MNSNNADMIEMHFLNPYTRIFIYAITPTYPDINFKREV